MAGDVLIFLQKLHKAEQEMPLAYFFDRDNPWVKAANEMKDWPKIALPVPEEVKKMREEGVL